MTNNPKEELKPCPFCGNMPKVGSLEGDKQNWAVWCDNKECGGACFENSYDEPCKKEMLKKWNTRTTDKPDGRNDRFWKEQSKIGEICEEKRAALEAHISNLEDDAINMSGAEMFTRFRTIYRAALEELEQVRGDKQILQLQLDAKKSTYLTPEKDRVMELMEKQLYNLHNNFIYLCDEEYPKAERDKTESILAEYAKVKGEK